MPVAFTGCVWIITRRRFAGAGAGAREEAREGAAMSIGVDALGLSSRSMSSTRRARDANAREGGRVR
jgi:hypothetical protein